MILRWLKNPIGPTEARRNELAAAIHEAHLDDPEFGYRFLADRVIELNGLNPQIAARLAAPFNRWRRFDAARQALMKEQLERIMALPDISGDLYEIASRALA